MAASYPALAFVANRVLRMHATTCAAERNWSLWGNVYTKARNRLGKERAEKLIYIRGNSSALAIEREGLTEEEIVMRLLGDDEES
ncbi:hypothetical protein GPECTOR_80g151 [Gonium pectorale]|uniref:HAT C-terminal dimerisation domain-containing protein n=1 Tax=Gonium pectorale TaxID=33097 RepID=A0A150G1V2_GONPE|nr:hypothetical protein GPECTOR_80g151 [Gonium pectorale]|eukprot:KXZ43791.1 hypothetical protein GPECTOR_80g151 [Gonium pectorale]